MPESEYIDICKELKPIMEQPIDFSSCSLKRESLVIPCDFEYGYNYKDFKRLSSKVYLMSWLDLFLEETDFVETPKQWLYWSAD